jgi:putative nucleotidyltransferase with HDIG domain
MGSVRVSQIISALSYALDLTEGRPMGHSVRTCIIGMRIATHIGVPIAEKSDLFYSLLLKDAGCSSNASRLFHIVGADEISAKRDVKLTDWTRVGWDSLQYALGHVATGARFPERVRTLVQVAATHQAGSCELIQIRCERGASIARRIGFAEPVAQAIRSLDEHWNGGGYPDGLRGAEIPLFSRILNLSQTLEVFYTHRNHAAAMDVARARSGRWFDPDLVKAAASLAATGALWRELDESGAIDSALALEPEDRRLTGGDEMVENICQAFAEIIDAKSPFTYRHSHGVADAAVSISRQLGLSDRDTTLIRRAALLHDIGKLSVPNTILEKPGPLTPGEWDIVKQHPYYSYEILRRVSGFERISEIAAAHHEKLDGSGYFRHLSAAQLPLEARILVVADIFDALSANRPYRESMGLEKVFGILQGDAPRALDAQCVEALIAARANPESTVTSLDALSRSVRKGGAEAAGKAGHDILTAVV